ncbi:DUF4258 domain-containing protein [Vibrio sp. S234-5]|uniref:DUF4258 domain-containing protein n=1 Tax=Vibrio sp. S234-5 TaxID=1616781 RepID=UPI0005ED8552|nr:DUF4258 domain-containing protein [Vibrio sp. S234-5]KJR21504.1 hypothetical protein UF06_19140 [Vibrio sp. S234-5]
MPNSKKISPVLERPLTSKTALKLINELATSHPSKIRIGQHTKERMLERRISTRDIFNVLKSPRTAMVEGPNEEAKQGDYTCQLRGVSAGESITVILRLNAVDIDPSAKTITVYVT